MNSGSAGCGGGTSISGCWSTGSTLFGTSTSQILAFFSLCFAALTALLFCRDSLLFRLTGMGVKKKKKKLVRLSLPRVDKDNQKSAQIKIDTGNVGWTRFEQIRCSCTSPHVVTPKTSTHVVPSFATFFQFSKQKARKTTKKRNTCSQSEREKRFTIGNEHK